MSIIDSYIDRLEQAENGSSEEDKSELVKEVVSVFSDRIPTIKSGLDRYKARVVAIGPNCRPSPLTCDDDGDIRKLIGKLKMYRESQCSQRADEGNRGNVYVTQNANPYMSQSQSAALAVSISQVLDAVETDDFSEEEQQELKAMLLDAECNKGNEPKLREIGKKIADFAFDKAVSSLPNLLAFVANLF